MNIVIFLQIYLYTLPFISKKDRGNRRSTDDTTLISIGVLLAFSHFKFYLLIILLNIQVNFVKQYASSFLD